MRAATAADFAAKPVAVANPHLPDADRRTDHANVDADHANVDADHANVDADHANVDAN